MFGILYLTLCFCVGNLVCRLVWPELDRGTKKTFKGKEAELSSFFLLIPAWFVSGTLPVVWTTYILGYIFQKQKQALLPANIIVFVLYTSLCIAGNVYLYKRKKKELALKENMMQESSLENVAADSLTKEENQEDVKTINETDVETEAETGLMENWLIDMFHTAFTKKWTYFWDVFYIVVTLCFSTFLMFLTFYVKEGKIWIGPTVHGDFSAHIAVIRSFSRGNNFPTVYPHFGGQDIRYHFMFQFLAGNLEFLGLRIDYAFNLPSIISMFCVFLILFLLAYRITGKKIIAALTGLFFTFRSAMALFNFLKEVPISSMWQTLSENTVYIGTTVHEDWGLYCLNVYVNQRHLALGMTVMMFVLYMMLECFYSSLSRNAGHTLIGTFKSSFLSLEGWKIKQPLSAVVLGVLLGMTGFFHGSCVIACLLILFFLAMVSDRRLEFLVIAVLSLILVLIQSKFFVNGSVTSTKWYWGFLSPNKTILGVTEYVFTMMGFLPVLCIIVFIFGQFEYRWLLIAFSAPFVFAFTISLTPDVAVNHKFIMISTMLWDIFAALLIDELWNWKKKAGNRILSIFLIICMISSGVYDFWLVIKKNYNLGYINDDSRPMIEWVDEHADSHTIFLTSWETLNCVLWAGSSLYLGWPYYPWSAGYNTYYRRDRMKEIYEAETSEDLIRMISEQEIDYIVVDPAVRHSIEYVVNEDVIKQTYECVYSVEETQIYDTTQLIN